MLLRVLVQPEAAEKLREELKIGHTSVYDIGGKVLESLILAGFDIQVVRGEAEPWRTEGGQYVRDLHVSLSTQAIWEAGYQEGQRVAKRLLDKHTEEDK